MVLRHLARSGASAVCILAVTVFLGSCDLAKNQLTYDRSAEMDRQDYRDAFAPLPVPPEDAAAVPDFEPVVATPEELRLPSPLVTVSVNQTVSLRDLMFELADQAGVDLEMDPQIHGSIIFTAKERPFDEVVNRIAEMAGLRYTFENHVLRIELDRPYVKSYNVEFLNLTRSAESEITTSVDISSGGGGGGESGGGGGESSGGGTGTATSESGSSSSISSTFSGDLWQELQQNIEQILTSTDTYISLATLSDPAPVPVNPMPPPLPDPNNPNAAPVAGQAGQMPAAVAPTLNVSAVAGEPLVPNPPATFSISRQSGIVSVFATQRQQKQVEKYINEFRRRATTQVLIEAKILQVDLTDEFATGIDWGTFNLTGVLELTPDFTAPALVPGATSSFTGVFQRGNDLNVAARAISRFGTVRALSSPRITALNNQPAIVNIARNVVFFQITNDTTTSNTTAGSTVSGGVEATPTSVPEGILMTVIPTANPDTGEVYLAIRPTITRVVDFKEDPSIAFIDPDIELENNIPEVATQEMDSIVRLQSGQMMVMGGLMKDANTAEQEGLPLAGDLPFLGALFRNHGDKIEKSELVIFLKATIVEGGNNADDMDRKVYRTFSLDRRPARL